MQIACKYRLNNTITVSECLQIDYTCRPHLTGTIDRLY